MISIAKGSYASSAIATTKLTPFSVSIDEWDIKEDTVKSMNNALYVLQYAKGTFQTEVCWTMKKSNL